MSIALFILFAAATLLAWLLPSDEEEEEVNWDTSWEGLKGEFLTAFRYIAGNNLVLGGLALLTFSQALVSTIVAVAPGYARSILGIEVADTSTLMLAPAALGMILGALLLSRLGNFLAARYHSGAWAVDDRGLIAVAGRSDDVLDRSDRRAGDADLFRDAGPADLRGAPDLGQEGTARRQPLNPSRSYWC